MFASTQLREFRSWVFVFPLVLASSFASAGEHLEARNCELFIDHVELFHQEYGTKVLRLVVKTYDVRLDAPAVQWGFRHDSFRRDYRGYENREDFRDQALALRDDGLRSIDLSVSNVYGNTEFNGAFFVRTQSDTTYWLHPSHEGSRNFRFGNAEFEDILSQLPNQGRVFADTQSTAFLGDMNPERCR